MIQQDLLPPLHSHCRCAVIPVYESSSALEQPVVAASPNADNHSNWYDALLRIPSDARALLNGFVAAQQERIGRGTLSGFLDWLTMGTVSGLYEGLKTRTDAMTKDPSLYNIVNWLTLGTADMVKGAFSPEKTLSLEHWLDSLGVVSIAFGAYELAQKYAPTMIDDVAAFENTAAQNTVEINLPEDALIVRDTKYVDESGHVDYPKYAPDNGFVAGTKHIETVCLLVLRNPVTHINIDVDVEEMVQDKRGLATYGQIKDYVLERSGLKVSSLYIAQVKQKHGIIERENYNKPKSEDVRQPQCPPDKERAITEALKHFGMIWLQHKKKPKQYLYSAASAFLLFSLICFAPCPHGIQNGLQALAEFRQRIFHSRWDFGVDLAVYQSAFLHCPELGGQDLLGHIAYGLFQFPEPLRSRHQVTQDQHLPLVPDEGQRSLHGTGRKFVLCFCLQRCTKGT